MAGVSRVRPFELKGIQIGRQYKCHKQSSNSAELKLRLKVCRSEETEVFCAENISRNFAKNKITSEYQEK